MAGKESLASSISSEISAIPETERIQSNCGLFAVIYCGENPGQLDLRSTVLRAGADLQHRAEGGAGYAVFDGKNEGTFIRGLGRIDVAFQDGRRIPKVEDSRIAILHTRYPTSGDSEHLPNIQPLSLDGITLAHHGNLTNARLLQEEIDDIEMGGDFPNNDSWIALNTVVRAPGKTLAEKLIAAQKTFEGGWAFIVTDGKDVVASRDPQGIRPLFLAWIGDSMKKEAYFLSVETAPFNSIDVDDWREVLPGETIEIKDGEAKTLDLSPDPTQRSCIFEAVYMMHPDSKYMGQTIYVGRRNAGHILWQEQPIPIDENEQLIVMPVPDSGRASAIGYFKEARKSLGELVDYDEGLLINRYVGRNFIKPTGRRNPGTKFFEIEELIKGNKIVLVDDSLVRGETTTGIIAMLRNAGAREVHSRIASPRIMRACHWGIAMSMLGELAGYRYADLEHLTSAIGADSIRHISLDGLYRSVGADDKMRERFCAHCFGGNSPRIGEERPRTIPLRENIETELLVKR